MPDHVFANCGFRELDSQLQEFAMDSRCSPADIVEAQSPYELAGFFGNAWPPGLSMPNFPGPVPTEPATVPVNNSSGFHNPEGPTPSGPELGQCDPETPIRRFQFRLGILSLKHKNLVSKGKDLRLQIGPSAEIRPK